LYVLCKENLNILILFMLMKVTRRKILPSIYIIYSQRCKLMENEQATKVENDTLLVSNSIPVHGIHRPGSSSSSAAHMWTLDGLCIYTCANHRPNYACHLISRVYYTYVCVDRMVLRLTTHKPVPTLLSTPPRIIPLVKRNQGT
jgi:hypothetical protein